MSRADKRPRGPWTELVQTRVPKAVKKQLELGAKKNSISVSAYHRQILIKALAAESPHE